jgi:nitroreductase
MDAYRCIISKRDLRTYDRRSISDETLRQILEAGRRSGSSRNRQPWEFIAITDGSVLARLARCGRFARHLATARAAIVVVVEGPGDLFDAGRCAQSLMLAAWSLGVASCPVTLQRTSDARAALSLPEGPVIATTIALGYASPAGRSRFERLALRLVARRGRKPLEALVHRNRYGARR